MKKVIVFIYSLVHFIVDLACAVLVKKLVTPNTENELLLFIAVILYNFFAFSLKFPIGFIADKINKNGILALVGCLLVAIAYIFPQFALIACIIAGIGNAMYHIGSGIDVLNISDKKASLSGIYVSTGALGIFLGSSPNVTVFNSYIMIFLLIISAVIIKILYDKIKDKVINDVEKYIKEINPTIKGFNRRGLYRMKQFYDLYKDDEFVTPLVTQISWTNHLLIMSKSKTKEERDFYIALAAKEHYSKRELERQLDSAYYERYMLSSGKQPPELVPQTVCNTILDTYVLEFLDLPEQYSERNFRKAIIQNLKQFILEFGKDFTFIGEEYRVQVGGQDFFIDLLFYNRALSCLVPIELKIGKFKPEHIGQINFYLEALDRDVKKPNENPSVGLILCASKDDAVVEYALSRSMSPTLVSDYTLCLPDKQILKDKLQELAELALEDGEDAIEE